MQTSFYAEELVRRHADMVYKLALSRTGNQADAEDVFQEVFLRYCKKQPEFASAEHEKAWFIRVTINCSHKLWSSPFRRKTVPLDESLPASEVAKNGDILDSVLTLPQKYRTILHLFYYEDLSVRDISELLKIPVSTVTCQLSRARKLLREKMTGASPNMDSTHI